MSDKWCCEKCRELAAEYSPLCVCGAPKDWHNEGCTCRPAGPSGEDIDMCPGCEALNRLAHPSYEVPF